MKLILEEQHIYCAGTWEKTSRGLEVVNPYDGKKIFLSGQAEPEHVERAIAAANRAKPAMKNLASYQKYRVLSDISEAIREHKNQLAETIVAESGKPLKYALNEADRAAETFRIAAEESKRMPGEYISLDWTPAGAGREGIVRYFPAGVVAGIAPFNFPLNLVAHKVAPAIAAGCPIVIKPASATPVTALLLAAIIDRTDLPKGAFSVLPCDRETGNLLATHADINVLSFTGSPDVGWRLKEQAGKKKVVLELGGNAGAYVDETADIKFAVKRCITGGFAYAGQVCIHLQRIYVHEKVFDAFLKLFLQQVSELRKGDPAEASTDMNCLIDARQCDRVESWVQEAREKGADILTGGIRQNNYMQPTVITNTRPGMKVRDEEVFGPVVIVEKVTGSDEGIRQLNDTRFGLQAGIFTDSMQQVQYAFENLDVGGVIVNDVPTFRADHMPYGGVKDSGLGREGVKYAMLDFSEIRILVK